MGERASESATVERRKLIETQPAPAWGKERDESDSTLGLRKTFSLKHKLPMSDQCWPPPQASYRLQWKSTLQAEALRVLQELFPADCTTLTSHSQTPRSPHRLCLSPKQDCLSHVLPRTLLFGSGIPYSTLLVSILSVSMPPSNASSSKSSRTVSVFSIHSAHPLCYCTTSRPAGVSLPASAPHRMLQAP